MSVAVVKQIKRLEVGDSHLEISRAEDTFPNPEDPQHFGCNCLHLAVGEPVRIWIVVPSRGDRNSRSERIHLPSCFFEILPSPVVFPWNPSLGGIHAYDTTLGH